MVSDCRRTFKFLEKLLIDEYSFKSYKHTCNFQITIRKVHNKQSADCDAQLPYPRTTTPTFQLTILTRKVGYTDLIFGTRSGFISRSVHARLQVLVCSCYDLFHRG